jgi:NADPH2:quinone reductase
MKAVLLSKFAADIPSIKPIETPIPTPKPGQVLIRVTHVAPTFGDGLVATGKYQTKPPFPFIPGTECSGVVVGVGEGVQRFKAGMRGWLEVDAF